MKITCIVGFVALASSLTLALGLSPQDKPAAAKPQAPSASTEGAESFIVDSVHSSNVFKIKHNSVANFYGRFNKVGGNVTWNEKDPAAGSIVVDVKADSIDTNSEGRNKHLKSPEFFDVEKYPSIGFKSSAIKKTGEHTYDVTGDLTLHGVTKPITVKFDHGGVVNTARQGRRTGLETTFTIKRSDYGMSTFLDGGMLGDEVTMTISLECAVQQKNERE